MVHHLQTSLLKPTERFMPADVTLLTCKSRLRTDMLLSGCRPTMRAAFFTLVRKQLMIYLINMTNTSKFLSQHVLPSCKFPTNNTTALSVSTILILPKFCHFIVFMNSCISKYHHWAVVVAFSICSSPIITHEQQCYILFENHNHIFLFIICLTLINAFTV